MKLDLKLEIAIQVEIFVGGRMELELAYETLPNFKKGVMNVCHLNSQELI